MQGVLESSNVILRQIETAEAAKYAQEQEILFFESSAKSNVNISDIFIEIGTRMFACTR